MNRGVGATSDGAVCVVGSGYVGTVVAACFAWLGRPVVAVEVDDGRPDALSAGRTPFHEPDLDELLQATTANGRLRFTADLGMALEACPFVFVCVGTPSRPDGHTDLGALRAVVDAINRQARGDHILVLKSTVPIGSSRWIASVCDKAAARLDPTPTFSVVSNPEFLRQGQAVEDFLHPSRILLGGEDNHAVGLVEDLYRPLLHQDFPGGRRRHKPRVIRTTSVTSEMAKYAANAFLASKVSFINEIANICDLIGADVTQVARSIGMDPRIGSDFLEPGLGWGGSCLGKDLTGLISTAEEKGYRPQMLRAAATVNRGQRTRLLGMLDNHFGQLRNRQFGLLGLAFKPGTDDLRDAPAVAIAGDLLDAGATVAAYDPVVNGVAQVPTLRAADTAYDAAEGADAVILVTGWPEFRTLDLEKLRGHMRGNLFVDGRNALDPTAVEEAGLVYRAIGRGIGASRGRHT
jgi:nucleotide sugar dehydrogenase